MISVFLLLGEYLPVMCLRTVTWHDLTYMMLMTYMTTKMIPAETLHRFIQMLHHPYLTKITVSGGKWQDANNEATVDDDVTDALDTVTNEVII